MGTEVGAGCCSGGIKVDELFSAQLIAHIARMLKYGNIHPVWSTLDARGLEASLWRTYLDRCQLVAREASGTGEFSASRRVFAALLLCFI